MTDKQLLAISDALVDNLESTPVDALRKEYLEEGRDPDAVADAVRRTIVDAVMKRAALERRKPGRQIQIQIQIRPTIEIGVDDETT